MSAALSQAAFVLGAYSAAPWVTATVETLRDEQEALRRVHDEMSRHPESTASALGALADFLRRGGSVAMLRLGAAVV